MLVSTQLPKRFGKKGHDHAGTFNNPRGCRARTQFVGLRRIRRKSGNPTAPSGYPTAQSDAIVINVVAIDGAQSFLPNPSSVPDGRTVVWHNVDTVTHRVVLNDRSVDTGNLDPGTFSSPMSLGTIGGYHCSIHPEMVGTLTR